VKWGASRQDVHTYYRVDHPSFAELERLECFGEGGTLDESQFTALRLSASLPVRDYPDIGNDLVRVYLEVEDEDGETYRQALATVVPTMPSQDVTSGGVTGTLTGYSTLYYASVRCTREALTIPAGTVAISYATSLLLECSIPVLADASSATLNTAKTYDPLTSYLDIVNDLAAFAGFAGVTVDGMGNALLRRYVDPSKRSPAYVMQSAASSPADGVVFGPLVTHELDTFAAPNAYTVISSPADGAPLSSTATLPDAHPLSYASRGYWVDDGETVSDIADQQALDTLAARRLSDKVSAVESIEIEHLWVPYNIGDVVEVDYPEAGESWIMTAATRTTTLGVGSKCQTRLRRFV